MSASPRHQALVSTHLAGLLFGGTSLFSRMIEMSAINMTAIRTVIAVLALFAVLSFRRQALGLATFRHGLLMLVSGVLLGLHWITYFHAMQISSIAVGMIALFTYPMITIFLEPMMKGNLPARADILCGIVVLLGVLLMVPRFSLESVVTQGVLWGVFSAFLFSIRNIIQRHYLSEYGGEVSIMYQGLVVSIMTFCFVDDVPNFTEIAIWVQLIVLGALFTALPHVLFAKGLRVLNAKTVSLVSCLQPVYATFFALILLHERPAFLTLIGGVLIVVAAVWETYRA